MKGGTMETSYNRLLNNLDELKLPAMREALPSYMDMVARGEKRFADALYELTEKEKALRRERAVSIGISTAGFPFYRTLEDYDFGFQPSVGKGRMEDFATLRFADAAENILFVGSPGTGKTHLATAIGIEAAKQGRSVYFTTCKDLMQKLRKAEMEDKLEERLKFFSRYKVLIVDEIGYVNLDENASNLFFQLVSARYEKKSTIITTNKSLSKWAQVFHDPVIASAILDRLLHHSHVVNIIGPSYRTKDMIEELEDR